MFVYVKQLTKQQRYRNSLCLGKKNICYFVAEKNISDKEPYVDYCCHFLTTIAVQEIRDMG
jgi:hypothetical protein